MSIKSALQTLQYSNTPPYKVSMSSNLSLSNFHLRKLWESQTWQHIYTLPHMFYICHCLPLCRCLLGMVIQLLILRYNGIQLDTLYMNLMIRGSSGLLDILFGTLIL